MAEFPALILWTDAYLADTRHLSTIEHGAYLLLLITAWRSPGFALPNDDRFLRRAAGNPRNWAEIKPRVMAFWSVNADGHLYQKRLLLEASRAQKMRDGASRAGKASALKRNKTPATPVDPALERKPNGNSTLLHSSLFTSLPPNPHEDVGGSDLKSVEVEAEDDAQPQYRAPTMPDEPKPERPSRANGTSPRQQAKREADAVAEAEAAERRQRREAIWRPRLEQFALDGQWPSKWGAMPVRNGRMDGVLLPISLIPEFHAIADARAGPPGKAA